MRISEDSAYRLYLRSVIVLGLVLPIWGLTLVPQVDSLLNFALLLLLAAFSEVATTSVQVSNRSGITFGVGTTVAMGAIPVFGPLLATVVITITNLGVWLLKQEDRATWKKSWRQLGFNVGMHSLSIFVAANVYFGLNSLLGADSLAAQILPWLPAAIVYDQFNFWLLMGIIRLQNGANVKPIEILRDNLWATKINIVVSAVGGGLLAYAVLRFDLLGIIIFFLPIVLSAYAFRLYVSQMKEHLDNLEDIVAQRTQDLAELNRQKDAYLTVLSHDMLTPLSSMQLYTEMISAQPNSIVESPNLTETMLHSQRTLLNLVHNVLDIEKLESGQQLPSEKKRVDLTEIVHRMVGLIQIEADKRGLSMRPLQTVDPVWIMADVNQIERIILNLLSNAVKYTPVNGRVDVELWQDEDLATLIVADTGYGIPEAELPLIFEAFNRVEIHQTKAVGSGLGLAISKALIEQHCGSISVNSEYGKGTTFKVTLPLSEADSGVTAQGS